MYNEEKLTPDEINALVSRAFSVDVKSPVSALTMSIWCDKSDKVFLNLLKWHREKTLLALAEIQHLSGLDDHLAKILGYSSVSDIVNNYRPETDRLVAGLSGPHAWAIYKALLAVRS